MNDFSLAIHETQRYDITVRTRDGKTTEFQCAIYTEESWCVRITNDDTIVRISKNNICEIVMVPTE